MNKDCCSKCQAKETKKKYSKKNEEESGEKDVKEKQKAAENEKPKTDSSGEKGSQETSDQKDKKKKDILTWQHSSMKKEKVEGKNLSSEKTHVNPPSYTANSMMHHGCGPNPSHLWPMSAAPRGYYPPYPTAPPFAPPGPMLPLCGPPFSHPGPMLPLCGPYGGAGGPIQSYSMPRARVHISPYPVMAAAAPFPYWQARPYMQRNPMRQYTTYAENYTHADNYGYCFI
ncbi:PREDICTED: uncharacterized protein LOC104759056 [Camelina sativa]|uniref:Uncharacterized protein LOC104759056 n=1 Tax=Camelina sativa TaxID=90675 RepID=A0ABM0X450_CAMSA|nr:PREDICTED: uncharacterized protein LOC104759056 [Camelina sativa]